MIKDLNDQNIKLKDEKTRHIKLFKTKVDILQAERDKAVETRKVASDDLIRAQRTITKQ